jgi:hypothetical protein
MTSRFRAVARWACVPAALALLSACNVSTSDEPQGTRRVETWGSRTTTINGVTTTTKSHTVDYKKTDETLWVESGKDADLLGIWRVRDYTDKALGKRDCVIDLLPAKAGEYNYRLRVVPECSNEMKNIAVWHPAGETVGDVIVLVDKSGANIGEFDRVQKGKYSSLYRGIFTLTNGEVVKAHLQRW